MRDDPRDRSSPSVVIAVVVAAVAAVVTSLLVIMVLPGCRHFVLEQGDENYWRSRTLLACFA